MLTDILKDVLILEDIPKGHTNGHTEGYATGSTFYM